MTKKNFEIILEKLGSHYQNAHTELIFENPFELLIATMLSARCTDRQVNKITPELFRKYPTPWDFAELSSEKLEVEIHSCGFYRTKSANIINTCKVLINDYDGQVPRDVDSLQRLPGVGRKTANVVASNAFGVDAIAVDTHVFRVSNRLGLACAKNVEDTEKQLMENIPKNLWSKSHHWFIHHGRRICIARNPKCHQCFLSQECSYYRSLDTR